MTSLELAQRKNKNIERAKKVLRGADIPFEELRTLAKELKNDRSFGDAWRILARARRKPEADKDKMLGTPARSATGVVHLQGPGPPD